MMTDAEKTIEAAEAERQKRVRQYFETHRCCEQAEPNQCVCMFTCTCPVHGETHQGTHD